VNEYVCVCVCLCVHACAHICMYTAKLDISYIYFCSGVQCVGHTPLGGATSCLGGGARFSGKVIRYN
jgi:hypothetical protein